MRISIAIVSLVSFIALVIEWLIALALAVRSRSILWVDSPLDGFAFGLLSVIARACARLFH